MSAGEPEEWLEELRELVNEMHVEGNGTSYGFPLCDDPRLFHPDPEASTEVERAYHKACCEAAEAGKPPPPHSPAGRQTCSIGASSDWGLGTTTIENPQAADWAERLERIAERARRFVEEAS